MQQRANGLLLFSLSDCRNTRIGRQPLLVKGVLGFKARN